MKKLLVTALLTATVAGGTAQVKNQSHGYPIDPVILTLSMPPIPVIPLK